VRTTLDRDARKHYSRIAALKTDPGWAELTEALTAADEKAWARFATELRHGTPYDPELLAELKGTSKAIKLILDAPDKAARVVARENERKATE